MGELCEFEIDFEQFDDLRAVVVHDECGAHEDVWFYRFDGLKAENAKLRELVRDMWHEGAFAPGACYVETDRLEDRTRELGIEVDA